MAFLLKSWNIKACKNGGYRAVAWNTYQKTPLFERKLNSNYFSRHREKLPNTPLNRTLYVVHAGDYKCVALIDCKNNIFKKLICPNIYKNSCDYNEVYVNITFY